MWSFLALLAQAGDDSDLVMPKPNDIVFLAGMRAIRHGTVNITIEPTADGLWPALKAKVARVLHERAVAASNTEGAASDDFVRPRGSCS